MAWISEEMKKVIGEQKLSYVAKRQEMDVRMFLRRGPSSTLMRIPSLLQQSVLKKPWLISRRIRGQQSLR
jgi:hypothetical protein